MSSSQQLNFVLPLLAIIATVCGVIFLNQQYQNNYSKIPQFTNLVTSQNQNKIISSNAAILERFAALVVKNLSNTLKTSDGEVLSNKSTSDISSIILEKLDVDEQIKLFNEQSDSRKRKNNVPSNYAELQYSFVPQIMCPTMVRVGNPGDGGKWICNPWRLKENCIVFSLGINTDSSFERQLQGITGNRCKVYGFDSKQQFRATFSNVPKGTFKNYKITGKTNATIKHYTIEDIATELKIDQVDILKIDIEGSEFDVVPTLFKPTDDENSRELKIPICQLLIEVHRSKEHQHWSKFLKLIESGGFLLFQRESNSYCAPSCFEYAWIHRKCLDQVNNKKMPILFDNFL